ncbi:MAG: hypothetical protein JW986_09215, partial [Methanotrichaceae archaeon]|nr:hypothetical protein [Methanotrichaceae archaeon]
DVLGNHGNSDAWAVKLDQNGNIQWQRCLGGSGYDYVKSIQATTDGGYIMAGQTDSNDGDVSGNLGNSDAWAVKLDQNGNIQWQRCLGGSGYDYVNSIQATTDDGDIIVGNTVNENESSDAWVAKLDSIGNIQWNRSLEGTGNNYGGCIQPTSDGGYITAGYANSDYDYDAWVVKISPIEWQAAYGGSGGDYIWDALQTGDGGYVLLGETDSQDGDVSGNHGRQDAWVTKVSSAGDLLWQRCIGGSGDEYGRALALDDGGYLLAGSTTSADGEMEGNHGGTDAWVAMVSATGSLQWVKCYGGSGEDYATALATTSDGGYIVAGYTNSNDGDVSGNHGGYDVWVFKINSSGEIVWQRCYGGSDDDYGSGLNPIFSSDIQLIGYTRSNDGDLSQNLGGFDSWLLWLNSTGGIRGQVCSGGGANDFGYAISSALMAGRAASNDGTVSRNHGDYDAWMITQWGAVLNDDDTLGISLGDMTCFGGSSWDEGRDIERSIDGGLSLMVGSSQSNDGDVFGNHDGWDMWAVCLSSDETGLWDYAWSRCFGGSVSDYGTAVVPCSDGGWLLAGYTGSNDGDLSKLARQGDYDAWIVKLRS